MAENANRLRAFRIANTRRAAAGFTLLEGLLAGLVLALVGMAIGMAVVRDIESLSVAKDYQQAAALLDELLTRVDLLGPYRAQREAPQTGGFPSPNERFNWQLQFTPRSGGHLYEVTATVSWPSGLGQRHASASTLLNDPPQSRSAMLRWEDL